MKKLVDYKDEIHKCSKCGLCQSVCPIYSITGNDCSVSRGQFIMLNGVIKGDLKLNKNINKYLDKCLKCNACFDFCPSGIDARKVFLTAKAEYFENGENKFVFQLIKFFHSPLVFKSFLKLAKIFTDLYRLFYLDVLAEKFYPILLKFGWIGKKIILINEFLKIDRGYKNVNINQDGVQKALKVVYFKGCVNEYLNPKVKNSAEKLFDKMGIQVLKADFQCCGIPFLSSGNLKQYKEQALFNIAQIPDEFDYFLTDCASCQSAFCEYENYLEDEEALEKLKKINEKSLNVNDFLTMFIKKIKFSKKYRVTFHKPCHLKDEKFLDNLFKKSENVQYIKMKDYDKCCGFSGEFAIKNIGLSTNISSEKAKNALDVNADFILTACPSCVLGINQGLIENYSAKKKIPPVLNVVEFIEKYSANIETTKPVI